MIKQQFLYFFIAPLLFVALASGCDADDGIPTPKPKGYFRIALPEKKYVPYTGECPFAFSIPDYAHIENSVEKNAEPCWKNLVFDRFKATLYLSYKSISNDKMLGQLINNSWALTEKHRAVADGRRETDIIREKDHVYGTLIDVGGNAATALQFYLTDSSSHFIYGSLYFYTVPNKDSLRPVLDFLRKDILHLTETFQWSASLPSTPYPSRVDHRSKQGLLPDSKR
jgi:gliding motility-associated lipoprotein GldD